DHVLSKRARASNRNVEVPNDIVNVVAEIGCRNVDEMKGGASLPRCKRGIFRFIVAGIISKEAVKGRTVLVIDLGCKDGNQRRIDAARKIGPDGHISTQMKFQAFVD